MKRIEGDLISLALTGYFDVIVHGCNCHCSMGAGIARAICHHFPEAYRADQATMPGDRSKLGTFSFAKVKRNGFEFVVVNGYTQFSPSGAGILVDYEAVRGVMKELKAHFSGQRIGYPKIGAGLARGDWSVISTIISEELSNEDHTLVELPT
jgi:O-acetyl-ADP-ribose deacetylase (regulator of RNase III)